MSWPETRIDMDPISGFDRCRVRVVETLKGETRDTIWIQFSGIAMMSIWSKTCKAIWIQDGLMWKDSVSGQINEDLISQKSYPKLQ